MTGRAARRRRGEDRLAGVLLLALIAGVAAHQLLPAVPGWLPGVFAWLAAATLWHGLPGAYRRQAAILLALGTAGLLWGAFRGRPPDIAAILAQNQALVAMLAGVSFLRLLTPSGRGGRQPHGRAGFWRTLLATHLLGAVLNLAVLPIVARRTLVDARARPGAIRALTRGYTSAVLWSPFFAGMATALTYAPGADWPTLAAWGLPLAGFALAYTLLAGRLGWPAELAAHRGFPLTPGSLGLPLGLALLLLALHTRLPGWPMLALIAVTAPLVTAGLLLLRRGRRGWVGLRLHLRTGLADTRGEVILFLAAGFLGVGVTAALPPLGETGALPGFGPGLASAVVGIITLGAILGLHPLIGIAVLAPVLTPLDPDPILLGLTFTLAWSLGTALGPLSATQLLLRGGHGIPGLEVLRLNLPYGLALYLAGVLVLHLQAAGG